MRLFFFESFFLFAIDRVTDHIDDLLSAANRVADLVQPNELHVIPALLFAKVRVDGLAANRYPKMIQAVVIERASP